MDERLDSNKQTNPFQSPAVTGSAAAIATTDSETTPTQSRFETIGRVAVQWEKLRLAYNAVLLIEVMILTTGFRQLFHAPDLVVQYAGACLAANLCFCAGPLVDGYLSWFRIRSPVITGFLFAAGTLISIWLALALTFTIEMSTF